VVSPRPGLSVIMGAVQFGLTPNMIESRILKHTYGVDYFARYNWKNHKFEHSKSFGKDRYVDMFHPFVIMGKSIKPAESIRHVFHPLMIKQKVVIFKIYISDKTTTFCIAECPDAVEEIGEIEVPVSALEHDTTVTMSFGGTEIKITGENTVTHETVEVSVNFTSLPISCQIPKKETST